MMDDGCLLVYAPAMNTFMWDHPLTSAQLESLQSMGIKVIPPQSKLLACGDVGVGALATVEIIIEETVKALSESKHYEEFSFDAKAQRSTLSLPSCWVVEKADDDVINKIKASLDESGATTWGMGSEDTVTFVAKETATHVLYAYCVVGPEDTAAYGHLKSSSSIVRSILEKFVEENVFKNNEVRC